MDTVLDIVGALWILGLAAVFGGFYHQIKEKSKDITSGMFIGAVVAALAWVFNLVYGLSKDVPWDSHTTVYTIIAVALVALAWMNRKATKSNPPVWAAAGVLSALGLVLGLFW